MEAPWKFVILAVLVAFAWDTCGQTYKVTHFTRNDSLPSGEINGVTQDSAGFVWAATNLGLYRFEGRHFVRVYHDTVKGVARHGESFIAYHRNMVTINSSFPFDRLTFETLPIRGSEGKVDDLMIDSDGSLLWTKGNSVHAFSGRQRSDYALPASGDSVTFHLVRMGDMLMAIGSGGEVCSYSEQQRSFVPFPGATVLSEVYDAVSVSDSSLVLASSTGVHLLIFNSETNQHRYERVSEENGFRRLALDASGHLWAVTEDNLLMRFYQADSAYVIRLALDGTEPHRTSLIRFPPVNQLFIDRHNNLWVCHERGLAMVSEIPFVLVDPEMPNEIVRSAAFVDEKRAYLSGLAGLFETKYLGFNDYAVQKASIAENVYASAICQCGDRFWLGSVEDKLFYQEDGRLAGPFRVPNASNIFFMFCDSAQDLWISHGQKWRPAVGLAKMTKELQLVSYGREEGFSSRMLVTRQDSNGTVYAAGIGDTTYLYRYDRERNRFQNISKRMKFNFGSNFEVHDIAIANDGKIWLASTAGLLVQQGDSIGRIDIDELYGKEVVAVTLANNGVVWAATEKDGLVRYSQNGYAVFDTQAGLQSGIMWYRSLFKDPQGKLWAGSREGISVSTDADPAPRQTEVPVLLSVSDNGERKGRKRIFNFESTLVIDFVSLSYPTRTIEYQYKFSDIEEWRSLRTDNRLILPEMESGRYDLQVRARQSGGYYWSQPMIYSFTVLRPWYASREAFLTYAVLLLLMIIAGTRWYNRRLLREKQRLEQKVLERTRELVTKQEEVIAQNQELHQLSDVLAANNENMYRQKEIIEKQNFLLQQAKVDLERKVEERTQELQISNEELAQQNVQLEQFAFMTAHNLRAPVARLLGLTSLLEMNPSRDPQEQELIKRVRQSSQTLDETIREISEILHIKKGLHGSFSPVDLYKVLDRMLPTFRYELENTGMSVDANLGADPVVRGIEPFVYSVFYNIVSNSIKYADLRKSPFLKVSVQPEDHHLMVVFEDNGIGFNASQHQEKLFKPFTRFNNIREGRGLGLYLMKIQMEMMGGGISLQSASDRGTTVVLRFKRSVS